MADKQMLSLQHKIRISMSVRPQSVSRALLKMLTRLGCIVLVGLPALLQAQHSSRQEQHTQHVAHRAESSLICF